MIVYHPAYLDEPEHYSDAEGHKYRQIVGGLAWPTKALPGFLVVMGQDLEADAAKNHHYWVLDEGESEDIGTLLRMAMDMRQKYQAQTWVGNTANKPANYLMGELMRSYPYKQQLSLSTAPHANDLHGLSFYYPLIKACLSPKKLLHLGNDAWAGRLMAGEGELTPPIAALGYALSELYGYIDRASFSPSVSYAHVEGAWML